MCGPLRYLVDIRRMPLCLSSESRRLSGMGKAGDKPEEKVAVLTAELGDPVAEAQGEIDVVNGDNGDGTSGAPINATTAAVRAVSAIAKADFQLAAGRMPGSGFAMYPCRFLVRRSALGGCR